MASIYSVTKQDVLSDAVVTDLQEIQQKNTFEKEMVEAGLEKENQAYCLQILKLSKFLITKDHEDPILKSWKSFCIENCKELKKSKQLGSMLASLVKLGVHEIWINTVFRDAVKKSNSDMPEAFNLLYEEYTNSLQKLKEQETLDIRIKNLENQIPLWAEPNKFDELYAQFRQEHSEITQILSRKNFDTEQSFLVKLTTLSLLNKYVDLMDKTFKSLEKSRAYSESQGELQAKRFKAILQFMKELMKEWVEPSKRELESTYPLEVTYSLDYEYLKKIVAIYDEFIPEKSQLQPSKEFNVSAATFNQGLSSTAVERNITEKCKTLEDYFTLMHQNLICTIQFESTKMRENSIYPQNFLDIQQKLTCLSIPRIPEIMLVTENFSYPEIRVDYHIPLRNHSGQLSLTYNQKTKKTKVHFELFEGRAGSSFDLIALTMQLSFTTKFSGKVISDFFYDRNKMMLSCELEIKNSTEAEDIFKSIKTVCEQTFEGSNGIHLKKKDFTFDDNFIEKFSNTIHRLISSPNDLDNLRNLSTLSKIRNNFCFLKSYIEFKKKLFLKNNPNSDLHDFFNNLNLSEKCMIFRTEIWDVDRSSLWGMRDTWDTWDALIPSRDDDSYDENEISEAQKKSFDENLRFQIIDSIVKNGEILIESLQDILEASLNEASIYDSRSVHTSYLDTILLGTSIQRVLNESSEADRGKYISKIGCTFRDILNHQNLKALTSYQYKEITTMMNEIMKDQVIPGPLKIDKKTLRELIENGLNPQILPKEAREQLEIIKHKGEIKKQKSEVKNSNNFIFERSTFNFPPIFPTENFDEISFKKNLTDATTRYFLNYSVMAESNLKVDFTEEPDMLARDYINYCKNTFKPMIDLNFLITQKNGKEVVSEELRKNLLEMHLYNKQNLVYGESLKGFSKLIDCFVQLVLRLFKQSRQDKIEEKVKIETLKLVDKIHKKK